MKYFLKADWEDNYKEVTKEQYIKAERNAGFHSKSGDGIATASFTGCGISGKTSKTNDFLANRFPRPTRERVKKL